MNVSVAVITYNSSSTIIETLDSILKQSYGTKKIELIISDDYSKDECNKVIDDWLLVNKYKFLDVVFIKNNENKGVSANCNEAWKACSYDWIKTIGGDDILKTACIEENVKYVESNSDCKIVFSKMRWFGSVDKITPDEQNMSFFRLTSAQQNKRLKYFSFNFAPTSFINRKALESVGYADENYRMIEDLPLWLRFTAAGYKLYFLDAITVKYRVGDSISMSNSNHTNFAFLNDLIAINKESALPFFKSPVNEMIRREQLILYKSNIVIGKVFKNKKNQFTRFIRYTPWIFMPIHTSRYLKIKLASKIKK